MIVIHSQPGIHSGSTRKQVESAIDTIPSASHLFATHISFLVSALKYPLSVINGRRDPVSRVS